MARPKSPDNDSEANDALLPTGVSPPSQEGNFPWRGMLWRFASANLHGIQIMLFLYLFAGKENLTPWERRAFNTLTILLSGLVSLSLGSLLGLLGSILRWRLLARASTTPRSVDLLLGMHTPTGAFKLICHHLGPNGKRSRTTAIVAVYLITNVLGRLSVATFGLTYDLNENVGVEYPAKVTDFGSGSWVHGNETVRNMRRMMEYALPGFWLVPTTDFSFEDPSNYTATNIGRSGLNLTVEGDKVTYSYPFKEFYGPDESPSTDQVVRSSSSCIGRTYHKEVAGDGTGNVYHKGKLVGQPGAEATSPDYLRALKSILSEDSGTCWWSMKEKNDTRVNSDACEATYLFKYSEANQTADATFYECKACLTDKRGKPGLDPSAFHGFPVANLSYAAGVLLGFTAHDPLNAIDVLTAVVSWLVSDNDTLSSDFDYSTLSYGCRDDDVDFMTDIQALSFKKNGKDWYKSPVPLAYELQAAHVVARSPILALVGAQRLLPKVLKEQGASERPYVTTSLEVKWGRSFGVLGAILVGQLLAIAAVYFYTAKKVLLRDHDSYLAVARLLRKAVSYPSTECRSTDNGEEIARRLEQDPKVKSDGIKYGTRTNPNSGVLEGVDLWYDLDTEFNMKAREG